MHCRHCFRKRLVGRAAYAVTEHELHQAIDWIAEQPELHEVILTGGDPLTLSDERLMALLQRLDAIPHIWSLRLHTRMPVVISMKNAALRKRSAGLSALCSSTRLISPDVRRLPAWPTALAGGVATLRIVARVCMGNRPASVRRVR